MSPLASCMAVPEEKQKGAETFIIRQVNEWRTKTSRPRLLVPDGCDHKWERAERNLIHGAASAQLDMVLDPEMVLPRGGHQEVNALFFRGKVPRGMRSLYRNRSLLVTSVS